MKFFEVTSFQTELGNNYVCTPEEMRGLHGRKCLNEGEKGPECW